MPVATSLSTETALYLQVALKTKVYLPMRHTDFIDTPAGILVPTVYDAKAFVPHPLPPDFDVGRIAFALGDARYAIGELRGACRKLVNPNLLIRPLQRLEAQTTSAMEGTYTTTDALAKTEAGLQRDPSIDDIEAANFTAALTEARNALVDLPISGRLLKIAHARLMYGVQKGRGRDAQAGEYARDQNMIGGTNIEHARFVPPPPAETLHAMSDLERYINRASISDTQALIDIALVHYQFETIHPFADGNGRLGRMLITLMAMTQGQLDLPILYMSPELEKRKDEYIDKLYAVSASGKWEAWLLFFFEVLVDSCRRTTGTIERIVDLNSAYRERVTATSRSINALTIVDAMFDSPFIDVARAQNLLGVSSQGARNILAQLVELKILLDMGGYPKLWLAPEILMISDPEQ